MKSGLSDAEGRALHGVIEDMSGDWVIRVDHRGFLTRLPPNFGEIWPEFSGLLILPHICDLARSGFRDSLLSYTGAVLSGAGPSRPLEFVAIGEGGPGPESSDCWFALSLRRIESAIGDAAGALGLLRAVSGREEIDRASARKSNADRVTGLTTRRAFAKSVQRCLAFGDRGTLAILAIERMRSLAMHYGQPTADEIMWGFARFIESMAPQGSEIGRVSDGCIAVILPMTSETAAERWARDAIATFETLAGRGSSRAPILTVSAGLAKLESSVEGPLRRAELGLVMARAAGGHQVGKCAYHPANLGGRNPRAARQQWLFAVEDALGASIPAR